MVAVIVGVVALVVGYVAGIKVQAARDIGAVDAAIQAAYDKAIGG